MLFSKLSFFKKSYDVINGKNFDRDTSEFAKTYDMEIINVDGTMKIAIDVYWVQKLIFVKLAKKISTPAGIRTRVRALATPGDNHYTTGVLRLDAQTRTRTGDNCLFRAALSQTELPGHDDPKHLNVAFRFKHNCLWWARGESNSGPPPCQGDVITS